MAKIMVNLQDGIDMATVRVLVLQSILHANKIALHSTWVFIRELYRVPPRSNLC